MVVIVDDEKGHERYPAGAGRHPPSVATPDRSWTPANGHREQVSSHNGPGDLNGSGMQYERNSGGSMGSGSGSITSLRIG